VSGPRVLLMTLSERISERGNVYLSGWLGRARLVGFKAKELDRYGNEQWEIYAAEPPPKADGDREPRQQSERAPPPTRGQRAQDRARAAGRARQAGEAVLREAGPDPRPEPPESWLDDADAAIRDLVHGAGR
jgi:hypothetical protein